MRRDLEGETVCCLPLLGVTEKMEGCGSCMKESVLLRCCWKTVVQKGAKVSCWSCHWRLLSCIAAPRFILWVNHLDHCKEKKEAGMK